jgi:hypothetical protein
VAMDSSIPSAVERPTGRFATLAKKVLMVCYSRTFLMITRRERTRKDLRI